ncbi:Glycerol-3-phosphate dehydrogenase, mitochondrial [Komagataella phaffii CBS 7435]|uniref:Glycerol-3-phosphate dehydrogenase n=2 Tax=Komagataella phaffii TaxID=460519 RepID=C4R4Z1_KOMPG|nr:Mitochondrial glycerol-3-phosphate dehydrogenase [Komagataella phaffii GS115]AOA63191.1 GQ67_03654T0 [Komagataella phaffii]CAH2449606.1 Glycerol-3-phosphate dehydrogenase, mitochondrial [Komagataella phaffii CBS 7435]AOA68677.1 GQ68_03626T0 [Komagataella phaffii GS115]CAY70627.1 Mitochondrial glycerol-3-phosphate dehydrogenase [Komagataella phaffii GS115]CCA39584.1 Glycerol-3-phosphate dehydrogenase, mitochondrial [Komagataella phaffii CBS 7435]
MFRQQIRRFSKASFLAGAAVASAYVTYEVAFPKTQLLNENEKYVNKFPSFKTTVENMPSREEMLKKLGPEIKKEDKDKVFSAEDVPEKSFDLVIIGGGASGAGSAVDASLRGLNVLVVEKEDFAAGTSSKSTKMAHGGVRYLEKAIFQLSKAQLDLVIEALAERASMLENAPHLATILPIAIPIYKWWQLPYMYSGCLMYDLFAGRQALRYSYIQSRAATLATQPQLDSEGLKASLVYHDGSFNDARFNTALALTAIKQGATVLNYTEVEQLLKNSENKVKGVRVRDRETGKEYLVKAEAVLNCTGPYSDRLLDMDHDPKGVSPAKALDTPRMVVPSGGVHIVLPEYYCSKDVGLLDASTSDGRVMFFLPWQGRVLAGTTDVALKSVPEHPVASEDEIEEILKELQHYVTFEVKRDDVLSAWCGVRPLVKDPRKAPKNGATQELVRNHLVHTSDTGLVTLSGGKWTTYREMSQDAVDEVLKVHPELKDPTKNVNHVEIKPCQTQHHKLVGAEDFDTSLAARLAQAYKVPSDLAAHLASNYGDRAPVILEIYKKDRANRLPVALAAADELAQLPTYEEFEFPFTVAELKYSVHNEYARHPLDFLARRSRLAFLDARAAQKAVKGVVKVMGDELNWDDEKRSQLEKETTQYIEHMGLTANKTSFLENEV